MLGIARAFIYIYIFFLGGSFGCLRLAVLTSNIPLGYIEQPWFQLGEQDYDGVFPLCHGIPHAPTLALTQRKKTCRKWRFDWEKQPMISSRFVSQSSAMGFRNITPHIGCFSTKDDQYRQINIDDGQFIIQVDLNLLKDIYIHIHGNR